MKPLLQILPTLLLALSCTSPQPKNPNPTPQEAKTLDLSPFPEIQPNRFQVSYYDPDDSPKYAPFLDQMKPLESTQCAILGCRGQEPATAFRFKINDQGAFGVAYGSKHNYGWWEFDLVVFGNENDEFPSAPFALAYSDGDAGEGLYGDSWIEDLDGDGVPEIVHRSCTFLWPGAENYDPSKIYLDDPILYTYSHGQYKEKSTFKDPDNTYQIRAIDERNEAIKNDTLD
jgi:hypothetical protein